MNITWTRPRSLRVELPEGTDITSLRRRINKISNVAGSSATTTVLTVGIAHNISDRVVRSTYREIRRALLAFGIITPSVRATRAYKVPAR